MNAPGGCDERAWCTIPDGVEHDQYHAGDPVELAGSDGSLLAGWWGWLTEDRGSDLVVELEGHQKPAATVTASDIAVVLAATATPESRQALVDLLASAGIEVPG